MSGPPEPDPVVELEPPVASVAWTPEVLSQSIEALFVYLDGDQAHLLRPVHADSLRLGWPPGDAPGRIVVESARRYRLEPLLAHSTSWRHEGDQLVITYLAAVAPPRAPSPHLVDEPVARADLARGDEFDAPPAIGVHQVVEHALRHLAWLVQDDAVVGRTLAAWRPFLASYVPEPFRALGSG